jgi:hypothetical protein
MSEFIVVPLKLIVSIAQFSGNMTELSLTFSAFNVLS